MASNYIKNLSNTYQQSPSLQNQFATEQDYLDLFDNNKTTPAMAKAYVPTNDTTGIKSIVNTATPITRDADDGDNNDPTGPTGFNIDDNLGTSDYQGTNNGTPAGGIAGTGITGKGLMAAIGFALNPIGFFIGRYAKATFKAYKEKKAKQDAIDKAAADAAQAVAEGRAYDYVGRSNEYGTHTSTMTNAQAQANQDKGRNQSAGTRSGKPGGSAGFGASFHKANGGIVRSYFKGGVVSLRNGGSPMYSEEDFPVLLDPKRQDGSKPSLYDYDGQYDNYDDEVIEIPMSGKMKKPKKKKKKKTKNYFNGGLVSLRGR